MVVEGGFEPPKLSRQIYSLIPLAARELHHLTEKLLLDSQLPELTGKTTELKQAIDLLKLKKIGAGKRSRTPDRLITSQLLYQLGYASISITERDFSQTRPL